MSWWRRAWAAVRRWFDRSYSERPRALGAGERDPAPGSEGFLRVAGDGSMTNDLRDDAWIQHLRAELPFPQPAFGSAEAPTDMRELLERFTQADLALRDAVERAAQSPPDDEVEPDWFGLVADRFLPLASWYVGLGLMHGGPEAPDRLRELADRARRVPVPGLHRTLDWLREKIDALSSQNSNLQAAHVVLWKVHIESLLRPLAGDDPAGVEVTFDVPSHGARIAELVPPPAAGSPTSGIVARVLCPSITVRYGTREWARGAQVRAR